MQSFMKSALVRAVIATFSAPGTDGLKLEQKTDHVGDANVHQGASFLQQKVSTVSQETPLLGSCGSQGSLLKFLEENPGVLHELSDKSCKVGHLCLSHARQRCVNVARNLAANVYPEFTNAKKELDAKKEFGEQKTIGDLFKARFKAQKIKMSPCEDDPNESTGEKENQIRCELVNDGFVTLYDQIQQCFQKSESQEQWAKNFYDQHGIVQVSMPGHVMAVEWTSADKSGDKTCHILHSNFKGAKYAPAWSLRDWVQGSGGYLTDHSFRKNKQMTRRALQWNGEGTCSPLHNFPCSQLTERIGRLMDLLFHKKLNISNDNLEDAELSLGKGDVANVIGSTESKGTVTFATLTAQPLVQTTDASEIGDFQCDDFGDSGCDAFLKSKFDMYEY